jgi:hypothetical protein
MERKKIIPTLNLPTPAMIEAGIEVYLGYCPDSGAGDSVDRRMIEEIFSAMICVKPQETKHRSGQRELLRAR